MSKRRPTVRDGELHIYWGRESRGEPMDVIYHNGSGTSHRDLSLLHCIVGSKRAPAIPGLEWEPSLIEELESRGYDLTTLRFYIRKKPAEDKGA